MFRFWTGTRGREVANKGSGKESFWGLNNPDLKNLIRAGKFDAVLCFVGYVRASFWIARRAARANGSAFLFGTDAHSSCAARWESLEGVVQEIILAISFSPGRPGDCAFHWDV